jgi:hypothetical protein
MAFQVRDLMVKLEPSRQACPTLSLDTDCTPATAAWQLTCGPLSVDTQCPTASAEPEVVNGSAQRLQLLRQQLAARLN